MTKQAHFISGICLAVFIGLHLFNHSFSISGASKHIEMMGFLRPIYRNIIVEALLLFAVMIQVFSGLKLFYKSRRSAHSGFEKLHILTGLYLALFFIIHVSAVITGRFLLDLDTNFYFAAAGLSSFPFNLFFIPYYGLAIISFFGHIASIHNRKMKRSILGLAPGKQSFAILIIGLFVTIVIISGFARPTPLPGGYEVLIGK